MSGNDTTGTITINTGGSPPAGTLASVTFANGFNASPKVQITPVGSSAASLDYYVERDASGFRVGVSSPPNGSTTYIFDYFVAE